MSERGSFVTEYIYCNKCLEAAVAVLVRREKHLCSQLIPGWVDEWGGVKNYPPSLRPNKMPIIAGKIGGLYSGEELHTFEFEFSEELSKRICHKLKIAVIPESGESKIFTVEPVNYE